MPPRPPNNATARGEFDLISELFRPLTRGNAAARDLLDDAAVMQIPPGRELVTTVDALVAEVHFLASDGPADIAWKALAVNLSDLAAMGADPRAYLLATAWPRGTGDAWMEGFAAGLGEAQDSFGVTLIGGDTVATAGPLTLAITAYGTVPTGTALSRAGALPGDDIYVSGSIGDAALGLRLATGGLDGVIEEHAAYLLSRLRRPQPRLRLGRRLRGIANSAIDVSDGLVADAGHIARASGVAMHIAAPSVPTSDAAAHVLSSSPDRLSELLTGGDDYELLFSAPSAAEGAVMMAARESGVAVTKIGTVTAAPPVGVVIIDGDDAPMTFDAPGYRHLEGVE